MTRRLTRILPFLLAFGLSACATLAPHAPEPPQEVPVPVISETDARLYRVREIHGSSDFGAVPGFWDSFWKFIVGDQPTFIGRPYGLYADAAGRLAAADPGTGSVHLFDRPKGTYRMIYPHKDFPGRTSPVGITGDGAGKIWFTDSASGRVMSYDVEARKLRCIVENLSRPTGIAFNRTTGILYVAETGAHEVIGYDTSGNERLRFGGRGDGAGKFNFPTDISLDRTGRILVTDALNGRIQIFTPEGSPVHLFGSPGDSPGFFAKPKGIGSDSRGWVYVADALFDAIQVFDPEGTLILTFGRTGTGPGEFWMPTGVFLDQEGLIYVADSYNRRIQVFRLDVQEEE